MSPLVWNDDAEHHIRFIPLSYDSHDSEASALKLIYTLMPQWASEDSKVELIRFTDGITNTLLKAVNRRPGLSKEDVDREAILLRAYGNRTDLLIDREREAANHELLMKYKLAPELLARFENGMLYRFVSGTVALPADLRRPDVLAAVARRLAEWHALVPCLPDASLTNGHANGKLNGSHCVKAATTGPHGKLIPNVWTTLQKWVRVLPTATDAQRKQQAQLQRELDLMMERLGQRPGLGHQGLVFSHCDLLCANIIIHSDVEGGPAQSVSFIDYEYGTPSPAAFDLANHFAEWAGYECDYSAVPTRSQRRAFITEYIQTYFRLRGETPDINQEIEKLMAEVDVFRGLPGFYWGIWSLIQAMISEIDFDYASYAEERLGEYWAYKAETDGSRAASNKDMPLREKTWSQGQ
ncbi:kinase-like domain-containing protein [Stachybotrys elegans]|uniref:ethanolamine kinase n=1 Tax=Stachybotrys elegans TaxID=80388 RepID=A0A8K0SZR3_9HYPO|nr:kinase-like domain-containing protein [Stachybotrys elegans]